MGRKGSVLAVAAALVVALAGCQRKDDEVVIADPVAEALAHAPADAAALAVVATDAGSGPGAALARLGRRFPALDLALGPAQAALGERVGLEYATEIRPLLGHPLVLWSEDGSAERRFAAWVVRDGDRLGELLRARERSGALAAAPAQDGSALFTRRGGGAYARRGPVLVSAPDLPGLRRVLARRQAGRGQWSAALLRERGLGLPEGAVARVALDAGALVARRGGSARRVPWVAALERTAVTLTAEPGGLRVRVRVTTDAGALAPNDVPIAPGAEPPVTRGRGRIVAAVRAPQQTLRVLRRTVDMLDPRRLDGLRRAEETLARFARVSVQEDLLDRLTGSATLTSSDGRTVTLRSDLDRPEVTKDALERLGTLSRLGGPLADLAGVDLGGIGVDAQDSGRFVVTQDGRPVVALAVVDGALVASTDPGAYLTAAARVPAAPRPAAAGALRATLDAELLKDLVIDRLGLPAFARGGLTPVGDLVVTGRAERDHADVELVLPIAG